MNCNSCARELTTTTVMTAKCCADSALLDRERMLLARILDRPVRASEDIQVLIDEILSAPHEEPPEERTIDRQERVDHPAYYNINGVEAINVIEAWELNFSLGSATKYIARAGRKSVETTITDLKKARWYLTREIVRLEKADPLATIISIND